MSGEDGGEEFPYLWYWQARHGERRGERCRVWARGSMNSIGVEFEDGFRTVTGRHAVRRAPPAATPDGRRRAGRVTSRPGGYVTGASAPV